MGARNLEKTNLRIQDSSTSSDQRIVEALENSSNSSVTTETLVPSGDRHWSGFARTLPSRRTWFRTFLICLSGVIALRLILTISNLLDPTGSSPQLNIAFPPFDMLLYHVLIIALSLLLAPCVPRAFDKIPDHIVRINSTVFLVVVFLFVLVLGNVISYFTFDHFPRDVDDLGRLFQARTFAAGRLSVEVPPAVEAFAAPQFVVKDGRLFSGYDPGTAIVYTLWKKVFGVEWGPNALLGATIPLLVYWSFCPFYGELVTRLALVLLCLSPFFIFHAGSFNSHVPALFFVMLFLFFFTRAHRSGKMFHLMLSGFWLGIAFGTRPYTTLLVSLPFVVWLFLLHNHSQRVVKDMLFFGIGFAVPLSALLYYNYLLTGHPLLFPMQLTSTQEGIGFGYKGHTPLKAVRHTAAMLEILNINFLGWPSSLFFPSLFIVFGKKHRWDMLFATSILCIIIGFGLYNWIDFAYGPRYYFEIVPLLVLLTAKGMTKFVDYGRRITGSRFDVHTLARVVGCVTMLSFAFSFVFYLPPLVRKYHDNYEGMVSTGIAALAEQQGIRNALVFVRESPKFKLYLSVFLENSIDFAGQRVYVRDRGRTENEKVIAAYPARQVYYFEYDEVGGGKLIRAPQGDRAM